MHLPGLVKIWLESVCGLCAECFFLVRIFKLNLESRGMFAELSYLTIILTNINIIMLSVRRMLESKKSASETIYDASAAL